MRVSTEGGNAIPDDPVGPAAFDQASLFIDDCADCTTCCVNDFGVPGDDCVPLPPDHPPAGRCHTWWTATCEPCWDDADCNLPTACGMDDGASSGHVRPAPEARSARGWR